MSYANNLVKAPVNQYDVQAAIGCGSGDWGVLCTHANINPMAKFKPVRYAQKEALTLAQITSTRFGFGSTTPWFTGENSNPSCTWEYQKPRGDNTGEFFRITDFDKYFHRACVPFAFNVSGALQDGLGLSFYINNTASTYYNDQGMNVVYDKDYGLSVSELFAYSTNASDYGYITICIHDLTNGDSVVVETNKRLRDLGTSVYTIVLYPTETIISGVTYPAVSMLNNSTRSGNNFRIIVGLMNSNTEPSKPYIVFDGSTTPNPSGITIYSLAFAEGIDRKDLVLSSHYTIAKLGCYFDKNTSSVSMTYVGIEPRNGVSMAKFLLNADLVGVFVTPSDHWSPENGDVAVKIVVSASGLVGTDTVKGSVTVGTFVNIPIPGHTYYFDSPPLYQLRDIPVYFWPRSDGTGPTGTVEVYIDGFATEIFEEVPFGNTLVWTQS